MVLLRAPYEHRRKPRKPRKSTPKGLNMDPNKGPKEGPKRGGVILSNLRAHSHGSGALQSSIWFYSPKIFIFLLNFSFFFPVSCFSQTKFLNNEPIILERTGRQNLRDKRNRSPTGLNESRTRHVDWWRGLGRLENQPVRWCESWQVARRLVSCRTLWRWCRSCPSPGEPWASPDSGWERLQKRYDWS